MISKHIPHLSVATFHILFALRDKPLHGYEILKKVAIDSENKITLLTGTLYNSLKRLLLDELIAEVAKTSQLNRRYYRLTVAGRLLLATELERYVSVTSLVKGLEGAQLTNV